MHSCYCFDLGIELYLIHLHSYQLIYIPPLSTCHLFLNNKHTCLCNNKIIHTRSASAKMSIDTSNNLIFHYTVRDSLCYLTLTERSYPKRLAFLYLEEIADAFLESLANDYGDPGWREAIATTARPYAFIKFDLVIQRRRKDFVDPTSRQNTTKLNEDLADIQSIMRKNINEVLNRGEKLENVSNISNNLVAESKKFKWGAKKLTWQAMLNQYGPIVAAGVFVIFVLYMKFFW